MQTIVYGKIEPEHILISTPYDINWLLPKSVKVKSSGCCPIFV